MNSTRFGLLATITAFSACGTLISPIVMAQGGQEEVSQDTEVLTRGPVHEAFAESVSFEPQAGVLIGTQPPEAIDELPPEQELEGENVTWIAGYWAWDEDSNDFMWISGIWRNIPPDREWVPGYWNDVGSQYQWVSGYWEDSGTEEVSYLPEPPKSLENGPNVERDSDDDVWIPGSWTYVDTRYRWRPGYYQPYRRDWSYVPDRYTWTPRGYVYVGGYWDYPVERRGIIFAPVRFRGNAWREPNYHYSPVTVINIGLVVNHLFVRPSHGHYYFGDYYEPRYRDRGFYASANYAAFNRRGFDPIFAHQRWEHRADRNWERNRLNDFEYMRDNRDARPPQNWAGLKQMGDGRRGFKGRDGSEIAIATPLAQFAKDPGQGGGAKYKMKQLNQASREKLVNQRQQLTKFTQQRKQIEKEGPAIAKTADGEQAAPVKPAKVKVQRSPLAGRRAAQMSKEEAPPKRKQAPAVTDNTPGPDGDKTKPTDENTPGRGQGGRGQGGKGGKGNMPDEDTAKPDGKPNKPEVKPDENTPQPGGRGKGGRGQGGKGGKGDNMPNEDTTKPDGPPAKPDSEPTVKPTPEREREPKVKPTPEREPKVKPTPQPQPERQPKVKPTPQPQREKVQPKPQPKPERQVQPQREKVQPKPQPKPERQVQPQPQREKVQPKPQPQPQPQRGRVQPQRQPQGGGGGGGGKGKGKGKDKEAE
ncbi:hypothetical protein [Luteolibacter sp. Populi]|uniref:hypothetical protein n=1 Tax=Luteolibacter sp. Populi TaxID=3230487 RepID=UPI003467390D